MGLFGFFKKKEPETAASRMTNSFGESLDCLTPEGDLPWGWVYANRDFTGKIQNEYSYFLNAWIESKEKHPKEQYAALKSFVVYMKDVKRLCDGKGECFSFWRSEILFEDKEIEEHEKKLQYIKDHFDDLEDRYQREQYIMHCVLPQLPEIIKVKPGILQTEIYKMFPVDCKDPISYELYKLSGEGRIFREKSGRTYSLHTI